MASSTMRASRSVGRLTRSVSANSFSVGRRWPACSLPSAMSVLNCSTTVSEIFTFFSIGASFSIPRSSRSFRPHRERAPRARRPLLQKRLHTVAVIPALQAEALGQAFCVERLGERTARGRAQGAAAEAHGQGRCGGGARRQRRGGGPPPPP